jgi:acyl-CoA dehydrogenase
MSIDLQCLQLQHWANPSAEHLQWQHTLRQFVEKEISPNAHQWDEAETFPLELYQKAGALGLSGLGYPAQYGGSPCDSLMKIITILELARAGLGGLNASLLSHTIMVGPLIRAANENIKNSVVPSLLAGQAIGALAITEADGGSDVAALKTTASEQHNGWLLNGSKCYITSGVRANYILVAARTGGPGASGLSLFLVDGDTAGLKRNALKKTGWWCSDTAELFFDNCLIAHDRLIGEPNKGFGLIMHNFNDERLTMAAGSTGFAITCFDEALEWAKQRKTFGKALIEHQVVRHKLVNMLDGILPMLSWLNHLAIKNDQGLAQAGEIALAKNRSGRLMRDCADSAIQILGGAGFMRGSKSERVYRDVKVMMIGGGTEEVMNDLAAKQLGLV